MNVFENFIEGALDSYPIPSNYGEGFSFRLHNGVKYITKGSYDFKNPDYRIIALSVTTFGVQHYYGSISIGVDNVNEKKQTHRISGYMDGIKIPSDYQSLHLELVRKVTQDNKDKYPLRWKDYEVGEYTNAFYSSEEIVSLFKNMLPELLTGKWCVRISTFSKNDYEKFLADY